MMPYQPDTIDLQILDLLQRDASLSSAEVADRVGLSQSPCWRRVQRLREEGFIKRIVAVLDKRKVGMSIQVFVQAKMTSLNESERAQFLKTINNTPEIVECFFVLGETDILLRIVAPDVDWYQSFVLQVLLRMPGIVDVKSTVIGSELKSSTAVPLGDGRTPLRSLPT